MKTEELKNLGLHDSQIRVIFSLHGKVIEKQKNELKLAKARINKLEALLEFEQGSLRQLQINLYQAVKYLEDNTKNTL